MNGVAVNVVVVVINAPYPSLYLKSKESKLEPPIVETMIVCKHIVPNLI